MIAMKRVLLIPTILLMLAGGLCYWLSTGSTAASASTQQPIVFCNADEVKTLDPGKMSWANDIRTAMALWEGLVAYEPQTLAPVPGMAESWDISADGKTYTFHIRANARWSNGDPVTAADFLFAWKRVLAPITGADYTNLFSPIVGADEFTKRLADISQSDAQILLLGKTDVVGLGMKAPDPRTVVVQLRAPCAYFLDLCAFPPYFPLHEVSMRPFLNDNNPAKGYDGAWAHPPALVTNGPYQLAEWKFKQYLLLTPNANYWDRANVKCDHLYIKAIPNDERAALLAYQTGTVDALSFVPQQFGDDLLAGQKAGQWPDVHYRPVFGTYYYMINCTRPPLDDRRIRKALALAIDRREIVEKVTRMDQRPLGLIVPPESIPGYTSPPELVGNIELAKKLLADAGYPGGAGLRTLELLYNSDAPIHGKIAQAIGQMWQRNLGINVTYRALERAGFSSARHDHDFDISRGGWYGDYADPTTWLDLLRTGDGNNDGEFSSPAYDSLLNQAAAEPDAARRFGLLQQAEGMIVQDELPFIPLYQYGDGFIFNQSKIEGLYVNVRLLSPLKWIHRAR